MLNPFRFYITSVDRAFSGGIAQNTAFLGIYFSVSVSPFSTLRSVARAKTAKDVEPLEVALLDNVRLLVVACEPVNRAQFSTGRNKITEMIFHGIMEDRMGTERALSNLKILQVALVGPEVRTRLTMEPLRSL